LFAISTSQPVILPVRRSFNEAGNLTQDLAFAFNVVISNEREKSILYLVPPPRGSGGFSFTFLFLSFPNAFTCRGEARRAKPGRESISARNPSSAFVISRNTLRNFGNPSHTLPSKLPKNTPLPH